MGSWFCGRLRLNFKAFAWRGIYMTAELVKKWLISGLISGNLAIWTVLVLEKVLLHCFWVLREIKLRFCSKTQWQMFPVGFWPPCWCPSGWAPTWRLHTNLYKFGEELLRITCIRKIAVTWILASLCIVTFFLFSDSSLNLLNGFVFVLFCFASFVKIYFKWPEQ